MKGRRVKISGKILHVFKDLKALIFVSDKQTFHRVEADAEFISRVKAGDFGVLEVDDVTTPEVPRIIDARFIGKLRRKEKNL